MKETIKIDENKLPEDVQHQYRIKNMDNKKEKNPAHCWKTYIEQAKKTGLESPIPYKVIPYKNGMGIKKIEFNNIPIVKTEKRVNEIMEDMLSIEDPQSL